MANEKIFHPLFFLCVFATATIIALAAPKGPHKPEVAATPVPRITLTDYLSQPFGGQTSRTTRALSPEMKIETHAKNLDVAKELVGKANELLSDLDTPAADMKTGDAALCDKFDSFFNSVLAEGRSADGKLQSRPSLLQIIAPNVAYNDLPPALTTFISNSKNKYLVSRGACPIRKSDKENDADFAGRRKTIKSALEAFRENVKIFSAALDEVK